MSSEHLIIKYITRSITVEELEQLEEYLKDPVNDKVFRSYIELNYTLDDLMDDYDHLEAGKKLRAVIKKEKEQAIARRRVGYTRYAAVAAAVLLLVLLPFLFRNDVSGNSESDKVNTVATVPPGMDKAVLTLQDGRNVVLEQGSGFTTDKVRSDGKSLVYSGNTPAGTGAPSFNYLTVPRGGQFYVQLPDSTGVWLNSESRLKYPVHFIGDRPREVELEYGEAYFDVSKSIYHGNRSFRVKTGSQTVEVLGTEFNIKAYRNENRILTTLVEGKVAVRKGTLKETMLAGQQSVTETGKDILEITEVNTTTEVAWKNGLFVFHEMSLEEMMKILSRWYDLDVKFETEDKKGIVFSGILNRFENINGLLKNIERTGEVSFRMEHKTLIVK
ncbi:FecR family protein [Sinomicrobium soli]|uniref:FecR family protein n=1 Tax=Sinomicrobium sp. N-1-3-6 TaxID=2219864 RepID=UPI000DCC7AFE|nr:FecR family protein [Sinomicrobium sp. N-1-3-6]RAV28954.1 hypothetical protein DN748_11220 [Sinomicrobium sp. N-1-3-6]